MSVPGQLLASLRLSRISIGGCRGNILFEPVQLGFEALYLLPDISEFLQASVSAVCNSDQLDRYLVMLDERAHSTEGGL